MIKFCLGYLAVLFGTVHPALAQDNAAALLGKALAAFESNQANEKHWNWNIAEERHLLNRSGAVLQSFPSVTSESVIRSNGRRCNALTAWGDGRAPYMKDADPDERCQAFNAISTPFQVQLLLQSANANIAERTPKTVRISILPDKSLLKAREYAVRCAASIKAMVELDPATSFPVRIDGEVAESGCNGEFQPVVHYETWTRQPMTSQFRKGASFYVVYALQKDKFDNPANSFWISTEQHFDQPWNSDAHVLFYWGRQVAVNSTTGRRLIKDVKTSAREFGAGSQLRFDK